jgi:hypothetical protein
MGIELAVKLSYTAPDEVATLTEQLAVPGRLVTALRNSIAKQVT